MASSPLHVVFVEEASGSLMPVRIDEVEEYLRLQRRSLRTRAPPYRAPLRKSASVSLVGCVQLGETAQGECTAEKDAFKARSYSTCKADFEPADAPSISTAIGNSAETISSDASAEDLQGALDAASTASSQGFWRVPGLLSEGEQCETSGFQPKFNTLEAHEVGQCRPCRFFWFKSEGCLLGDQCKFCHFCKKEQARDAKLKAMYAARRAKRRAAMAINLEKSRGTFQSEKT